MEEILDILETGTLFYFRDTMGLAFPPDFARLARGSEDDRECSDRLNKFKVTHPNQIIMILHYIKYFYPYSLRIENIFPAKIVKIINEKVYAYMKLNEKSWFNTSTMGEQKKKSLKNFSKGNIRFLRLCDQLKIFKVTLRSGTNTTKRVKSGKSGKSVLEEKKAGDREGGRGGKMEIEEGGSRAGGQVQK